jgi:hypothetical protein
MSEMDDTRAQLREMWCYLAGQTGQLGVVFPDSDYRGDAFKERHRALLDALIEVGDLPATVAGQLQTAFDEAVFHTWRSQATCYLTYPIDAFPRDDLLARAQALGDVEAGLDAQTVAQASAAIEQDIAFFHGKGKDKHLNALWQSGEIPVGQGSCAAARFLVDLLSEGRS